MRIAAARPGWTAFVAVLCALPLMVLVLLSLGQGWRYPGLIPQQPGAQPWLTDIWTGGALAQSIAVSVIIALTVAAVATAGGFVTGRLMAYGPKARRLLFLAYLPYAISPVIFAIPLMFLFFVTGLAGTLVGVIIAHLMLAYAFATIFFTAFWSPRMKAFEDLTASLGATPIQIWRDGLMPLARRALGLCFFQAFLISWFQYGLTLLLGTGRVQTLTIKVYAYVGEADIQLAAASGLLLAGAPLILLIVRRRTLFRRFLT